MPSLAAPPQPDTLSKLPNPEEYLSPEQRWEMLAALLANMVMRSIESEDTV